MTSQQVLALLCLIANLQAALEVQAAQIAELTAERDALLNPAPPAPPAPVEEPF